MTKNKKRVKPLDSDIHFKYRCTNKKCNICHWLSLNECKTKNFKIVCDCGEIFYPKRIQDINIVFASKPKSKQQNNIQSETKPTIPQDILQSCVKFLIGYGFTEPESENILIKAYSKQQTNNCSELIKFVLANIGELQNEP